MEKGLSLPQLFQHTHWTHKHRCTSLPVQIFFLQKKLQNSSFLPVLPHLPSLPCSGWVAATSVKLLLGFPQSRDGTSAPWQLVSSAAHLDFRKTLSAPVLSSSAIRGCGLAKMGGWGTRLNYCIQCHLFCFFFLRINNNSCSAIINNPTVMYQPTVPF